MTILDDAVEDSASDSDRPTKKPRKVKNLPTPIPTGCDYVHVVLDLEKCNSNSWQMTLTNLAAVCLSDDTVPKQIGESFSKFACPPSSVVFSTIHEQLTKISRKTVEDADAPDIVLRHFIVWTEACVETHREQRLRVNPHLADRPIYVCLVGHNVVSCDLDLFFNSFAHYKITTPASWKAVWYHVSKGLLTAAGARTIVS